jgi:hypothetical protein
MRNQEGRTQAHAEVANSDRNLDAITFIALATTLIVLIGHLMKVGLW